MLKKCAGWLLIQIEAVATVSCVTKKSSVNPGAQKMTEV
jgi:hypothetical protein